MSMWPLRISERPSPAPAGSHVGEHVGLAGDIPAERRGAGCPERGARRAGRRTAPAPARRTPAASPPGPASRAEHRRRATSSASSSAIAASSAATAARISSSMGPSLPPLKPTRRRPRGSRPAGSSTRRSARRRSARSRRRGPRAPSPGPWLARHVSGSRRARASATASSSVTDASGNVSAVEAWKRQRPSTSSMPAGKPWRSRRA